MLKAYRNTSLLILLVMVGVQWGFYKNYTSEFPHFIDKTVVIHVHGALLMTWMVLLIVQPLLIQTGRAKLHREIGKVSYVLGPLIIIFLFLIGRGAYWRELNTTPRNEFYATMALDIRGFISFAILWSLAMIYRKDSPSHMRYMIATGILGIGPGIGRGLQNSFGVSFGSALTITDSISLSIVTVLLGYDIYRKKNIRPSLVVFAVFFISFLLWQWRDTSAWQSFAKHYAEWFY
jgi:hypothetical protein